MLTLADLMTTDLVTVDPDMTLREAVDTLAHARVSGAPVLAGDRLVGVVSATDILEFESTNPGVPSQRSEQQEWGEWGPADRWLEDLSEPPSAYFRELWSDSSASVVERMADPEAPEWDFLAEHVVAEVMTSRVLALPSGTELAEAARIMAKRSIHRLLVTEDDILVGVVSSMDFVRAVADGRLPAGGPASDTEGGRGRRRR